MMMSIDEQIADVYLDEVMEKISLYLGDDFLHSTRDRYVVSFAMMEAFHGLYEGILLQPDLSFEGLKDRIAELDSGMTGRNDNYKRSLKPKNY
jgi:hypothetical protein